MVNNPIKDRETKSCQQSTHEMFACFCNKICLRLLHDTWSEERSNTLTFCLSLGVPNTKQRAMSVVPSLFQNKRINSPTEHNNHHKTIVHKIVQLFVTLQIL